jgi:signal transduction histidine kinase
MVEDDGRGFDAQGASPYAGGGLKSMRERAAFVGGILDLESASGGGTRIEVTVPLSKRG